MFLYECSSIKVLSTILDFAQRIVDVNNWCVRFLEKDMLLLEYWKISRGSEYLALMFWYVLCNKYKLILFQITFYLLWCCIQIF